jgi:D-aminopeptidase
VGHVTLAHDEAVGGREAPADASGSPGVIAVRTGVTAVIPHSGDLYRHRPAAGHFVFNGYGKSVGLIQLEELGVLETPILLTNTLSVWTAANALVTSCLELNPEVGRRDGTVNPVVGECSDAYLNDLRGRRVTEAHCLQALAEASDGPVAEGNVGAGTGMSCLGFKGGVGTASRVIALGPEACFTLGCLVVSNFGRLREFRLDGVPVGRILEEAGWPSPVGPPATAEEEAQRDGDEPPGGSIMIILATDAPLTSRQLKRLCRRAALGLGRTGSAGAHSSGDFVLAFSLGDPRPAFGDRPIQMRRALTEDDRNFGPLFQAAVEGVEEAIINSLFAAEPMTGRDGHTRQALPVDEVMRILG